MKLALISDIHGNATAFRAVLMALDKEGVNEIICLGDAIATGPEPAECVQLLRQRQIPTIKGNTDGWLLDPQSDPNADDFHRFIEEIDFWCRDQLTAEDLTFISQFQPTLEQSLGSGGALLAYHGSPRSYNESITATTPDETLEELLPPPTISIMAGGHTHQPLLRRYRDLLIINPGAVGLGYQRQRSTNEPYNIGWAEYAIIESAPSIPEKVQGNSGYLHIHFRRAPYSVDELRNAALSSTMPQSARWISGWET